MNAVTRIGVYKIPEAVLLRGAKINSGGPYGG
jgi:hypothetical protein